MHDQFKKLERSPSIMAEEQNPHILLLQLVQQQQALFQQQMQLQQANQNRPKEFKDKHANLIPVFHGNPDSLPKFLNSCDKIIGRFFNQEEPDDFQNEEIIEAILLKIQGSAEKIFAAKRITSYEQIKTLLLENFSDRRDIFTLDLEFSSYKQGDKESPFHFHERLTRHLDTTVAHIRNHIQPQLKQDYLIEHFENLALRCFILNLKEPMGNQIRARNPKTLGEALGLMTNEYQMSHNKHPQTTPPNFQKSIKPQNNFSSPSPRNSGQYERPQQPGFQQNRPNYNPNYNPNPFYKPIQRQFQGPRYPFKSPNFNQPRPNQFQKPTPMSWQTTNPNLHNLQYSPQKSYETPLEKIEEPISTKQEDFLEVASLDPPYDNTRQPENHQPLT